MADRSGEIYQNNDFRLLNNPFYLFIFSPFFLAQQGNRIYN